MFVDLCPENTRVLINTTAGSDHILVLPEPRPLRLPCRTRLPARDVFTGSKHQFKRLDVNDSDDLLANHRRHFVLVTDTNQ